MSDTRDKAPALELALTGDSAPVSCPGSAVYELAIGLGISTRRAGQLRVMIEELVTEAQEREHGEDPARVDVRAFVEAGHLKVRVTDRGLPVSQEEIVSVGLPHELVRLRFTEYFRLQAHGKEGNIAECSMAVSTEDARVHLQNTEEVLEPDVAHAQDTDLEIRPMLARECGNLARLVYRCYGYSYPSEDIYYPERMAALVESGLMSSVVAVCSAGELVGHAAATFARADARVAEAGKLVVDPRYRSHGLAGRMAALRRQRAEEMGLCGLWTECVTNHPFSQKNQIKLGAVETGIFLGIVPADLQMTKITPGGPDREPSRGSLVSMYLGISPAPRRKAHVPQRYRPLLQDIVCRLRVEREFVAGSQPSNEDSVMSVAVSTEMNIGVITVERVGSDLLAHLERRVADLLRMRVAAIYLDLPVADPGTAYCGDHISGLGFFFSALLPESAKDGDVLRMQYLNEGVSLGDIHLGSDWGREILEAVRRDEQRVGEHLRSLRLSG